MGHEVGPEGDFGRGQAELKQQILQNGRIGHNVTVIGHKEIGAVGT